MCGVTGWVDFGPGERPDGADLLAGMTATLECRGPDASGAWSDGRAMLGHTRLAVIDPEGGAQPMTRARGDHAATVSFCGEVENYVELRAELVRLGHRFTTASDTEVLLAAYLEWGLGAAPRLRGMFAAAIWDGRTRRLTLLRDRLGIKPLFFAPIRDGVVFGSEPKALLQHPEVEPRVRLDGLREVLDMVRTPGRTLYDGVEEVRPGTVVCFSPTGRREHRYWALDARPHEDDLPTTIATTRHLLTQAVTRQVHADVPIAALLSGGMDSSAVTAIAARACAPDRLATFAVDFHDADRHFTADPVRGESDAPFAREVARQEGTLHTEVSLVSADLADPALRRRVLRATDQPPAYWGDMWPSLLQLFAHVRRDCVVALSGEGADELFGGYLWFHNPSAVSAATFPWLTPGSMRYFGGTSLLAPDLLRALDLENVRAVRYEEALAAVPQLAGETPPERRMREISHLALTRFLPTLLDRKDRMSMAVGVEGRVPFCDHELVEYVFNVPWSIKAHDGREKSLLRSALAGLVPDSVLQRRKTPYPATQDTAYERALQGQLADVLDDSTSPVLPLLDVARARAVAERQRTGASKPYNRGGLEMALWLNDWLTTYRPTLELV